MGEYLTTNSRGGGANQITGLNQFDDSLGSHGHLLNGSAVLPEDILPSAPKGFDVEFDFDRNTDPDADPSAGGFLSFGFGANLEVLDGFSSVLASSFGVLFQQPAEGNAANGNVFVDGVVVEDWNFDYLDPASVQSVKLSIRPETEGDFEAGDLINFSLAVGGTTLVSDSFSYESDGFFGDVSFSSNNFLGRHIDNLIITAAGDAPLCSPVNELLGDLDGDQEVAFADFLVLSGNFGQPTQSYAEGDIDCDGEVAFADFLTLSSNFGTSIAASAQTVPEPSGLLLSFILTLAILSVRKRR